MSVGLLALLDDVVAFSKVAAASLDDVAGQAAKATAKAAGAVIDDTAVTPRYIEGFPARRELPIVWKIAVGSLRNKLLILLPAALALSLFLPAAITPLLMIGGAYLCYEGAEKILALVMPHAAHEHEAHLTPAAIDPKTLEDQRVAGAIKTDFILSAEIMTLALSTVPDLPFWEQAIVLAIAAVGITAAVYGVVALVVKADDIGLALNRNARTGLGRGFGRALVVGMPYFMNVLGIVGTAAMLWVGGGIIVHGLTVLGLEWVEHAIETASHTVDGLLPALGGFPGGLLTIAIDLVVGVVLGLILIPIAANVVSPIWRALKGLLRRRAPTG